MALSISKYTTSNKRTGQVAIETKTKDKFILIKLVRPIFQLNEPKCKEMRISFATNNADVAPII